ncbi:MAG: hypothetical protein M1361_01155, partial [Patescibacteria group bacterium]|nr:hypothetical protein [Patescibacteria group bacterium]
NRKKKKMELKLTQHDIIRNYLDGKGWVYEYKIRGLDTEWGFIGARGDRDVRQMIRNGELEASFNGKYRIVRLKRSPSPRELADELNQEIEEKGGQVVADKMPSPIKEVSGMRTADAGMPSLFPEEHSGISSLRHF